MSHSKHEESDLSHMRLSTCTVAADAPAIPPDVALDSDCENISANGTELSVTKVFASFKRESNAL